MPHSGADLAPARRVHSVLMRHFSQCGQFNGLRFARLQSTRQLGQCFSGGQALIMCVTQTIQPHEPCLVRLVIRDVSWFEACSFSCVRGPEISEYPMRPEHGYVVDRPFCRALVADSSEARSMSELAVPIGDFEAGPYVGRRAVVLQIIVDAELGRLGEAGRFVGVDLRVECSGQRLESCGQPGGVRFMDSCLWLPLEVVRHPRIGEGHKLGAHVIEYRRSPEQEQPLLAGGTVAGDDCTDTFCFRMHCPDIPWGECSFNLLGQSACRIRGAGCDIRSKAALEEVTVRLAGLVYGYGDAGGPDEELMLRQDGPGGHEVTEARGDLGSGRDVAPPCPACNRGAGNHSAASGMNVPPGGMVITPSSTRMMN
ncbi:hypothetical protein GA0115244_104117 [Streptomyces sp. DvalAA-19]|nr:hypothetical protein GA0115244_104117 [Streptomyces sp. DvalAA-19]